MKKKIIGLGIGIALAAAALGVTGYAAASGTESLFSNVIGEERAEEIVLDDAGVTRQEALMGTTILEYDNGQYVYDIEFTSEGLKYDYDILASDGSIVESSHEPVSKEDLEEDTLEAARPHRRRPPETLPSSVSKKPKRSPWLTQATRNPR